MMCACGGTEVEPASACMRRVQGRAAAAHYCTETEKVRRPMSAGGIQEELSPTELDHASPQELEPVAAQTWHRGSGARWGERAPGRASVQARDMMAVD